MKFNNIIMNPPYGGNLHLKIIDKCLDNVSDDGQIVNLSPVRWLQDIVSYDKANSDIIRFKELNNHTKSISYISAKDAKDFFGADFTIDLGIYDIRKSHTNGFDIWGSIRPIEHKGFLRLVRKNDFLFKKLADIDRTKPFCFIKSFWGGHPEKGQQQMNWLRTSYGYFINGRNSNGDTPEEAKKKDTRSTRGNISEWVCIEMPTEKEIRNLFNTDSTKFIRFMGKFLQTDVHVYPKYFPYVGDCINPRTGLKGYLSDWTDEDFYNYYELTNEEISIIEKEIN